METVITPVWPCQVVKPGVLAVAATGMVPLVVKRATDALKPLSIRTGRHRQLQGVSFGVVLVGILGKKSDCFNGS